MTRILQNQGENKLDEAEQRRHLLEKSRISNRYTPKYRDSTLDTITEPESQPPVNYANSQCVGCDQPFHIADLLQPSMEICRNCLVLYARIDSAYEEYARRQKQELLKKFLQEVE